MAKAKKSSTKNKKSKSKLSELKNLLRKHKLLAVLVVILLLVFGTFAYGKFKDWENAQFIKGLAGDFPALVDEIEQATGLDLEIKTDCSITTEKFTSGVRTCEVSIASVQDQKKVDIAINTTNKSNIPSSTKNFDYAKGQYIYYKNRNTCQQSGEGSIYISCVTAVREANIELARELFLDNKQ